MLSYIQNIQSILNLKEEEIVKLYGKKAIALAMAVVMTLSLCSVNAFAIAEDTITDVEFEFSSLKVPYGTTESAIEDMLPEYADITFADSASERWYIGYDMAEWYIEYDRRTDTYICTTEPDYWYQGNYEYDPDDFVFVVDIIDEYDDVDLKYTLQYSVDGTNKVVLDELIADKLNETYEAFDLSISALDVYISDEVLLYGEVDNYVYEASLSATDYAELVATQELDEEGIYYEVKGDIEFSGYLYITIKNTFNEIVYKMNGAQEFYFGNWLVSKLSAVMTEDLYSVEFTVDEDNECGTLYSDDLLTAFDELEEYFYNDSTADYAVEDIYFVANGVAGDFEVDFIAYGDHDEEIEGTAIIECDEFLYFEASIAKDETYDFSSDDFAKLIEDWDDEYSLVYIDNVKIKSTNGGKLCYKYDPKSTSNKAISSTEEYYVEKSNDLIDEITYVPSARTKGTIVVSFDAFARKSATRSKTLPCVLYIHVDEKANITIEAPIGSLAPVDSYLFQDYLEENIKSTSYDVAYVTISGAPRTDEAGYLVTNAKELTAKGAKTFYAKPEDDQYDLDDLFFLGGSEKGKTTATFTVYYYKTGTRVYSTDVGTIEFVTGGQTTDLTAEIKASQVLPFSNVETQISFENAGSNNNQYITFTTLPVGGKLVYNWGTASQEDVKMNTRYFINYSYGEKLLSNITFVPNYSAYKSVPETVSISFKGYNRAGYAVAGTYKITVKYAQYSEKFADVAPSIYADSVDFLFNQHITEGIPGGLYAPSGQLSRAELVTFLYRAAGSPTVTGTSKFIDVPANEYYYKAVLWAVQNGITKGTNAAGTEFSPNKKVTNQEIIQFMYNYDVLYLKHSAYVAGSIGYVYDYNKVADWAQNAIKWAVGKGVVTAGYLNPTAVGTRGDIALYLHRMLSL